MPQRRRRRRGRFICRGCRRVGNRFVCRRCIRIRRLRRNRVVDREIGRDVDIDID